jgi:hypothetical protein
VAGTVSVTARRVVATGQQPVAVYPLLKVFIVPCRGGTGLTGRFGGRGIVFHSPPTLDLLRSGESDEKVGLLPVRGGGSIHERQAASILLPKELDAFDEVGLVVRDGVLGDAGLFDYLLLGKRAFISVVLFFV